MYLNLTQHDIIDNLLQNAINETYHKYQKDNCECWKNHLEKLENLKKEWNDGNKFIIDFNIDLVNKDVKPAFDEAVNLVKKYMKKASDSEIDNFVLKMKFDEKIKEKNDIIKSMDNVSDTNIEVIKENNSLKATIKQKEAEIQTLRDQLKQVPDETKTADMKEIAKKCRCEKENQYTLKVPLGEPTGLRFLTEKEIEELWEKVKRPNAVGEFGNILILSIQ